MNTPSSLEWFTSLPVDRAESVKVEFAVDLDNAITSQGLTRKEISKRMGTSPAWVTKVLRGDVNLTIESMAKLAEAVNFDFQIVLKNRIEKSHIPTAEIFTLPSGGKFSFRRGGREVIRVADNVFEFTNDEEFADAA
jgi:transcriptional regulator with XRE-family HTH domain